MKRVKPPRRQPKAGRISAVKLSKAPRATQGVPDRQTLLDFLAQSGGNMGKRELSDAFAVKGEDRRALKALLNELEDEGLLARSGRKSFTPADRPPESGMFELVEIDIDGEAWVRACGREGLFGPKVAIAPIRGAPAHPALGLNERAICRTERIADGSYVARVIKKLGNSSAIKIVGVFHAGDRFTGQAGRVEPADKKNKGDLIIPAESRGEAKNGDLVACRLLPGRGFGPKRAAIIDVFGRSDDPRAASILAIAAHGIPMGFEDDEIAQAEQALPASLDGRVDLRATPLITIDPEDARDHDDAVFAEADTDPSNPGGWKILIAIADVSYYVTPGSALDRGALMRGNSVYFPDRVVPMLPEALSTDLCSLKEGEERACLAVEIVITADGRKRRHRFMRGLMRSAASLTYGQAQAAIDGNLDEQTAPILETIIKPLYGAYASLCVARDARSPLEIDSPERRIKIEDGVVVAINLRERFDAHRLIEEMMIQANVAAAEALEAQHAALIYRIHDAPSAEKIAALADFLATVGLNWTKGEVPTPARFNRILALAKAGENAAVVNEVVLRSQAQAIYDPENIGHFGLNLTKYAHFTSPIRRYADLIVHRALIRAFGFGNDGLTDREIAKLPVIAEAITVLERRAMAAERDATDRYVASFLADKVGAEFEGRITGVTKFGLFVRLAESGADGLCPAARLGREFFFHDERSHALVGQESGGRFELGQIVTIRLVEAVPVTGGLLFDMLSRPIPGKPPGRGSMMRRANPSRRPMIKGRR